MLAHLWAWFMANCMGNLIASALWVAPTFAWHHRRIKAHHAAELRKLRTHLLGAISEQRQDGDR